LNGAPFNQIAYLRTSREFPEEIHQLSVEVNKSYIDIANAINVRTIGIFPTNRPAVTGESYYLVNNQKQQTLRQVYTFTTTSSIAHGITVTTPNQFTSCFGSYTDGTNSYGLIFATSVAIAGQITFYVTSSQIVFVVGAGAPALTSGRIVLQWLSQP
jgi:hypothetical protein